MNDKEHNLHMRKRDREACNIQLQEEEHWEVYTSEIQYLPETQSEKPESILPSSFAHNNTTQGTERQILSGQTLVS